MKRFTLLGIVVGILLAACGGDVASTTTAPPTTAQPASTTTETETPADVSTTSTTTAEAAACDPGAGIPVTMAFPVEPTIATANFVITKEKGFWADRGLNVEFIFGSTGVENIGALTTGQADITFLDLANLGNLVHEGQKDLRLVMHWVPTQVFTVFTLADSDIVEPADLAGKKIGISGMSSVTRYILQGTLAEGGLTEEDVELVPVGATRVPALLGGEIDALSAWDLVVAEFEFQGYEVREFPLGPSEILPSNILAVMASTLEENPDTIRCFIDGLKEGNLWAYENLEEASDIAAEFLPAQFTNRESADHALQTRLAKLADFDPSRPYGWMDVEVWQQAADQLYEAGAIGSPLDVSEYVVNDLLDGTGE